MYFEGPKNWVIEVPCGLNLVSCDFGLVISDKTEIKSVEQPNSVAIHVIQLK